jgi:hypothetical protein
MLRYFMIHLKKTFFTHNDDFFLVWLHGFKAFDENTQHIYIQYIEKYVQYT